MCVFNHHVFAQLFLCFRTNYNICQINSQNSIMWEPWWLIGVMSKRTQTFKHWIAFYKARLAWKSLLCRLVRYSNYLMYLMQYSVTWRPSYHTSYWIDDGVLFCLKFSDHSKRRTAKAKCQNVALGSQNIMSSNCDNLEVIEIKHSKDDNVDELLEFFMGRWRNLGKTSIKLTKV